MIPKILHQTWKSKTDIPEKFGLWRQSFFDLNPDFEFRLYDDADNRALVEASVPTLLGFYDALPREIFRVDLVRAVYMFAAGGFYADMDFQCLDPLDQIAASDHAIIVGKMGYDDSFQHCIPNAFLASQPAEGFWLGYLDVMERAWERLRTAEKIAERPEYVTGPVTLRAAVLEYIKRPEQFRRRTLDFVRRRRIEIEGEQLGFGSLAILPPLTVYPINWRDMIHRWYLRAADRDRSLYDVGKARELFPNSIAVTYWASSWQ